MNKDFEKNILYINELIENNTTIFSNFSFIFNLKVLVIFLILSFSLYIILIIFKKKLHENKFIAILTTPATHVTLLSISLFIFIGLIMINERESENIHIIYSNIDNEYLDVITNSYPLTDIKLMSLEVPTYHIQYEKNNYFESYKTTSIDFIQNKIGLENNRSLFNLELIGNNFNKTAINISNKDEIFLIDNNLLKKELNRIEKDNNIDLSLIKETFNKTNNQLYKINLTEETFNKMIKKGVDN